MREEPFLEPGHEHRVEFQPLRGVHGHQLQRRAPLRRLGVARFERRVREERRQRIRRPGRDGIGFAGSVGGQHGGVDREIGLAQEAVGRVDELVEVVEPILAVLFLPVMRDESGRRVHVLDRLRQRQTGRRRAHRLDHRR